MEPDEESLVEESDMTIYGITVDEVVELLGRIVESSQHG